MQKPTYFEHQLVQPKNLEFLNSSVETTITEFVKAIGKGNPGIVTGMSLSAISGNNFFTVSSGFGYDGNGEYVPIYSGNNIYVSHTGSAIVYAKLSTTVYNPNAAENPALANNVVTNINPDDNQPESVELYNLAQITFTSGVGYIPLGTVTTNASSLILNVSSSGSSNFELGGFIDLNSQTINGSNVTNGTLDSDAFSNPLSYDFWLGSGTDILVSATGKSNIGTTLSPLGGIYAITGNFHELTGFSPIITDTLHQKTGTSIEATGNNFVQIDTSNKGTQFGKGIKVKSGEISTSGFDKNIKFTTDASKRVVFDTDVDIAAGRTLVIKNDLVVSGLTTFETLSTNEIAGNLNVNGSLTYIDTSQTFDNIVTNSDFSDTSIETALIKSGTPVAWSFYVPNVNNAWRAKISGGGLMNMPSSLNTAMAAWGSAQPFSIDMNIKVRALSTRQGVYFTTPSNSNIEIETDGTLSATFGGTTISSATGSISLDTWYNIAYTWDGVSVRKLYIDNVEVASESVSGSFPTSVSTQRIGLAVDGSTYSQDTLIDNYRISNINRTSFPSGYAETEVDFNTLAQWQFDVNIPNGVPNIPDVTANGYNLSPQHASFIEQTGFGQVFSGTTQTLETDTSGTNALFGSPHVSNWLLGSGNNLDPTGVSIISAMNDMKSNTEYDVSFYYKPIVNAQNILFRTSISGTANGSQYISIPQTGVVSNAGEWSRSSFNIVTPESGTDFSLIINPFSADTAPITGVSTFGLTAVQVSRGQATFPYKQGKTVTAVKPRIASEQKLSSQVSCLSQTVQYFLSRNVFVNQGVVRVNVQAPIVMGGSTVYHWIEIDGIRYNQSLFGGSWGNINNEWIGFLETGYHSIKFGTYWDGFIGTAIFNARIGTASAQLGDNGDISGAGYRPNMIMTVTEL